MEKEECVCGHGYKDHDKGGFCHGAWCICPAFDEESEYWKEGGKEGSWTYYVIIDIEDRELALKIKQIESYLKHKHKGKHIGMSDVVLHCLKQYSGKKEEREWVI
jgi:hypothetical protein